MELHLLLTVTCNIMAATIEEYLLICLGFMKDL
jgi:hypothetical protein